MKKILALLCVLALTACGTADKAPTAVKLGKPYSIAGETYQPEYNPGYDEEGIASWYGPGFHGNKTANGERFDTESMTAAHPTLPMPSLVKVTNLTNGKSVVVRINDRGPFKAGRIIDLSRAAARSIDIHGIERVRVQYLQAETERYWAENNLSTKSVMFSKNSPVPKSVPRVATQMADADEATQESTAPVLSVASSDIPALTTSSKQPKAKAFTLVSQAHAETVNKQSSQDDVENVYSALEKNEGQPQPVSRQTKGVYLVQAGAFSKKENADKLVKQLESVGAASIIKHDDSSLYHVVLSATSKEEAESIKTKAQGVGVADARIMQQ